MLNRKDLAFVLVRLGVALGGAVESNSDASGTMQVDARGRPGGMGGGVGGVSSLPVNPRQVGLVLAWKPQRWHSVRRSRPSENHTENRPSKFEKPEPRSQTYIVRGKHI